MYVASLKILVKIYQTLYLVLVDSYAFWLVGIYILLKLCSILARLQFLLLSMNSATTTSANPCVHYEEMSLEQPLSASLTSIGAFSLVLLHFKLKVVLLLHATEKCLDIFPRIFSLHFVSQGPLNFETPW